jgi:hypothetical protein
MKNYAIIATVALTASVAFASSSVDLNKVNNIINQAIQPALTETITTLGIQVDDKSNFESVETLNSAVRLTAEAANSKWSDKATTLDVAVGIKTLATDSQNTTVELGGSIGTKTETIPLYAYAGQIAVSDSENDPANNNSPEILDLLKEMAQTKSLNEVPAQLNKAIELLIKDSAQNPNDPASKIANSLKVETVMNGSDVAVVLVKISSPISFGDLGLTVSELTFKMTNSGLNLSTSLSLGLPTPTVSELFTATVKALKSFESETPETIQQLQWLAQAYVQAADAFIKGE